MTNSHNWKQITKVLEKLGYNSVSSYDKGFLYYGHPQLQNKVVVQKSNKLPMQYVNALLQTINLKYEYFSPLIRRCR